ncbi:MAG: hypothetical protein Q9220_006443 [cf. Caloplaca sp. 1 TL-2023]
MAILDDIEVRVAWKATKQALREYDDPKPAMALKSHPVLKYVQAEEEKDFQIEVYFKKTFRCWGAWGIAITIHIDGGVVTYLRPVRQKAVQTLQQSGKPKVLDSVLRVENSQLSEIGFRFGPLKINDDLEVTRDVLDRQATELGRILVDVERVDRKLRRVPKMTTSKYKPLETLEFAEDLFKDKYIMHLELLGCIRNEAAIFGNQEQQTTQMAREVGEKIESPLLATDEVEDKKGVTGSNALNPPPANRDDAAMVAKVEQLEGQLKESKEELRMLQDRTTAMMQSFMGGFSTFMQAASPTASTTTATSALQSGHPGVKRELIKDEADEEAQPRSGLLGRGANKRAKTVIELD